MYSVHPSVNANCSDVITVPLFFSPSPPRDIIPDARLLGIFENQDGRHKMVRRAISRRSHEKISRYSAGFCALFSAFEIRSGTQFHGCTDLSTLCRDKSHTYLPLPQIVCL